MVIVGDDDDNNNNNNNNNNNTNVLLFSFLDFETKQGMRERESVRHFENGVFVHKG